MGIQGFDDDEYMGVLKALKRDCPVTLASVSKEPKTFFDQLCRFTALTHNKQWPDSVPFGVVGVEWNTRPKEYTFSQALILLRRMERNLYNDEGIPGIDLFLERLRRLVLMARDAFVFFDENSEIEALKISTVVDIGIFWERMVIWFDGAPVDEYAYGGALTELVKRVRKITTLKIKTDSLIECERLYFESYRVEKILKAWSYDSNDIALLEVAFECLRHYLFLSIAGIDRETD